MSGHPDTTPATDAAESQLAAARAAQQRGASTAWAKPETSGGSVSQVYSLRIPADELDKLRAVADRLGEKPTVLLRRWALERLESEAARLAQADELANHRFPAYEEMFGEKVGASGGRRVVGAYRAPVATSVAWLKLSGPQIGAADPDSADSVRPLDVGAAAAAAVNASISTLRYRA